MSQIKSLTDFANEVLEGWPELGNLDGFEIQDLAEKHGLLIPQTRHEPCGDEECQCNEVCNEKDFARGVACFHKADWLYSIPDYQRPELNDEDKTKAETYAKALVKKHGFNNLPKMLALLCVENFRLVKEIQEHREARGIDPLPVFEV